LFLVAGRYCVVERRAARASDILHELQQEELTTVDTICSAKDAGWNRIIIDGNSLPWGIVELIKEKAASGSPPHTLSHTITSHPSHPKIPLIPTPYYPTPYSMPYYTPLPHHHQSQYLINKTTMMNQLK
jgi:hypothetical protein